MTTKGLAPTPMKVRLTIARLMQLHYDTHPKRIALTVGLSPAYCRRLWREIEMQYWPDNRMALTAFGEMKRSPQEYAEHVDPKPADGANDGICFEQMASI